MDVEPFVTPEIFLCTAILVGEYCLCRVGEDDNFDLGDMFANRMGNGEATA